MTEQPNREHHAGLVARLQLQPWELPVEGEEWVARELDARVDGLRHELLVRAGAHRCARWQTIVDATDTHWRLRVTLFWPREGA